MANVELIIKADTTDAVKNIRKLMEENQKLSDDAKQQVKDRLSAIEKEIYELETLRKARLKAQTKDEVADYNKLIEQQVEKLDELENAGRKVEKQTESMTQALGKWIGSLGLVTTVLNKLKEAFLQTTQGMNMFNIAGAALNQMLYNIVNGTNQWNKGVAEAIALQKQLNEIRMQNYKQDLETKKLMQEYNKLYTEGVDAKLTDEQRIKKLSAAKEKYIQGMKIEIQSAIELADIQLRIAKNQPDNEKELAKYFELRGRVMDLFGEIESGTRRLTRAISEGQEKILKKPWEDYLKWIENVYVPEREAAEKALNDALEREVREEVEGHNHWQTLRDKTDREKAKQREKWAMADGDLLKYIRLQTADAEKEIAKGLTEFEKEQNKIRVEDAEEAAQKKRDIERQTWETILEAERAVFDILNNNTQNSLNQELQALDLKTQGYIKALDKQRLSSEEYEKKKLAIEEKSKQEALEIERRYKKDQQRLAIAETIINGAVAIVKLFKDYTFVLAGPLALAMTALTALQVGVIKSQKFAKGGWTGKGGMRDETGERIAGIVHEDEFVTRKGPAKRYREVLEAINKDDRRMVVSRFNKIMPEVNVQPVNNITVENNGPNNRLDRINNQLYNLNRVMQPKKQVRSEVSEVGSNTIIRKGNNTRTVKR